MYQRSNAAIFADVGDDIVALHVRRGQCYGMDKVTARVWTLLAEPLDLDAICSDLIELYHVEADLCRGEVARLLEQMQKEGLVERVGAAG